MNTSENLKRCHTEEADTRPEIAVVTITTTTSETRDDAIVVAVPVVFGIGQGADPVTLIRDVVWAMVATIIGDGMILSGTTTDVTGETVSGPTVVAA